VKWFLINKNAVEFCRASVVQEKSTFWLNLVSENVQIRLSEPASSVYSGCGVTKSCFGLPIGCLASKNCVSFGALIIQEGIYQFEMLSSSE
jgi:hypothetical protein